MTTIPEMTENLERARLVAIIRLVDHANVVEIATTLISAGVEFLEVTIERSSGLAALGHTVSACAATATIGAGTVVRPEDVARVADTGARFVVTPNVDTDVIAAAHAAGLMVLPGAFTPTEVARAHDAGADFVKLFPAATGGVGHLQALRGPFPTVRFVPTGGVSTENAHEWFAHGASAVAMGSNLVPSDGSLDGLFERAQRAVAASLLPALPRDQNVDE